MSQTEVNDEPVDSGAPVKTPTTTKVRARKVVKATPTDSKENNENDSNTTNVIHPPAQTPEIEQSLPPLPSARKHKEGKSSARKTQPQPESSPAVDDSLPASSPVETVKSDKPKKSSKKPVEESTSDTTPTSKSKEKAPAQSPKTTAEPAAAESAKTERSAANEKDEAFEFIQKAFSADPSRFLVSQVEMETVFPKMGNGVCGGALMVPDTPPIFTNAVTNQCVEDFADAEIAPTPDEIMLKAGFLGQTQLLQVALMKGATLTYKDETGRNVIHYVTATKCFSLLKRILKGMNRSKDSPPSKKQSANKFKECINGADIRGWTPLLLAVCKGYAQIVEILASYPECDLNVKLSHSCLPNKGDPVQSSAVHFAAVRGDIEVMEKLLTSPHDGASGLLSSRDSKERIPAHYGTASDKTSPEFLAFLFSDPYGHPSDILALDIDDHTPYGNAVSCGRIQHLEYLTRIILSPLIQSAALKRSDSDVSKTDDESLTIPTKNLTSQSTAVLTFSSVLFAKDSNGFNCLQLAYLRGHTETLFALSRLWKQCRHPTLDMPTLAEAILSSHSDHIAAEGDEATLTEDGPENERLLRVLAVGVAANSVADLDSLEKSVFSTAATVLDEDSTNVQGQLARTVKKLGPEYCLTKIDETMKIEKSGGRLTADGKRRKTPGGVFYQLIKEDLQTRLTEKEFRALWRFITTEQNEKQKTQKKNNQKKRHDSAASSTSSHLHSVPLVNIPPPPPAPVVKGPSGTIAPVRNAAGRAGSHANIGNAPATTATARGPRAPSPTMGSSFAGSRAASTTAGRAMPSFAAPTAQYANFYNVPNGGQSASGTLEPKGPASRSPSRDPTVLKGAIANQGSFSAATAKRVDVSRSPDGTRRFAAATQSVIAQSRSTERMGGPPPKGGIMKGSPPRKGSLPRFAAMTEAAQGRMAVPGDIPPPSQHTKSNNSPAAPVDKNDARMAAGGRKSPASPITRNVSSAPKARPVTTLPKSVAAKKDIPFDHHSREEPEDIDDDDDEEDEDVDVDMSLPHPGESSSIIDDEEEEESQLEEEEVEEESKSVPEDVIDQDEEDDENEDEGIEDKEDCLGSFEMC